MNIREKTPDELRKDLEQFTEVIPAGIRKQILSVNPADCSPNLLKGDPYPDELRKTMYLRVLRHLRSAESMAKGGRGVDHSILNKQFSALDHSRQYIQNLSNATVGGNPLRETQKLAALGLYEWLKSDVLSPSLMGHLVQPMGSGKTNTAILFSEMVGGRTIVFAPNNSIADQTASAFVYHHAKRKTVGMCYGGQQEVEKDILVANFQSRDQWKDKVDWKSVRLMVCDEADINAISDRRREWIKEISEKHGIIVVGMSATEQQGSGKRLQDVFPSEIARMPIPDSLPHCLEMGLVPQLKFHDLLLDVEWDVNFERLKQNRDLTNDEVERLIQSTSWNKMILDHYEDNFLAQGKQPGLVIFRNNNLVNDFLRQAKERGIAAAAYTEKESEEERLGLRNKVANGELQLLVGSHLLGRGLDIPELNIIYNSTVTYSPQIFWQADGRGCRVDQNALDKVAHLIAVLPRLMKVNNLEELLPHQRPLCHAAFFDPDYFVGEERLVDLDKKTEAKHAGKNHGKEEERKTRPPLHEFDLSKCKIIRSTEEVGRVVRGLWIKGPDFMGRADILSEFLDSLDSKELTMKMIFEIIRVRNSVLRVASGKLEKADPNQDPKNEDALPRFLQGSEPLTLAEEKALMKECQKNGNSQDPGSRSRAMRAKELLIRAHLPLVVSMAKKFVTEKTGLDDLIQEGMISLNETIEKFDRHRSARLASYALINLYRKLERFVAEHSRTVGTSAYVHSNAHQLLNQWEKIKTENPNLIEGQDFAERIRCEDETTLEHLSEKTGLKHKLIKKILEDYWMEEVGLDETDHVVRHSDSFTRQEKEVVTRGDALTYEEQGWANLTLDPETNLAALETACVVRGQVRKTAARCGYINKRSEEVIFRRFGLGKYEDCNSTLSELASDYKVSNALMSQTEHKMLRLLSHPSNSRALRGFMEDETQKIINRIMVLEKERGIAESRTSRRVDPWIKRYGSGPLKNLLEDAIRRMDPKDDWARGMERAEKELTEKNKAKALARIKNGVWEICWKNKKKCEESANDGDINLGNVDPTSLERSLEENPKLFETISLMEKWGGEPKLIAIEQDYFVIADCVEKLPPVRMNRAYEEAESIANGWGAELPDDHYYKIMQKIPGLDAYSRSYLFTPKKVRKQKRTRLGSNDYIIDFDNRAIPKHRVGWRVMVRVPRIKSKK